MSAVLELITIISAFLVVIVVVLAPLSSVKASDEQVAVTLAVKQCVVGFVVSATFVAFAFRELV